MTHDFPILATILAVYRVWVQLAQLKDKSFNVLPVPAFDGKTSPSDDNDDDNNSNYDNRTPHYRRYSQSRKTQMSLKGSPVRKRKHIEPPQASGSK